MWQSALMLALLLVFVGSVVAEPTHLGEGDREATGEPRAEAVIRAAPGGGEMIILGPDGLYVIRGRASEGDLDVGCTRDDAAKHVESESR